MNYNAKREYIWLEKQLINYNSKLSSYSSMLMLLMLQVTYLHQINLPRWFNYIANTPPNSNQIIFSSSSIFSDL